MHPRRLNFSGAFLCFYTYGSFLSPRASSPYAWDDNTLCCSQVLMHFLSIQFDENTARKTETHHANRSMPFPFLFWQNIGRNHLVVHAVQHHQLRRPEACCRTNTGKFKNTGTPW